MTLRIETDTNLRCEFNHAAVKVFEPGQKFVHRLLCPTCDADILEEMQQKANDMKFKLSTNTNDAIIRIGFRHALSGDEMKDLRAYFRGRQLADEYDRLSDNLKAGVIAVEAILKMGGAR